MQKLETVPVYSPDTDRELQDAVNRLVQGVRDPQATKAACDRMDRMREEMRERVGEIEVAVDLIRDARDES